MSELRTFTAEDHSDIAAHVYLDGREVTSDCSTFHGSATPGQEVEGWVSLIERGEDGRVKVGPMGIPIYWREHGLVRWERFRGLG